MTTEQRWETVLFQPLIEFDRTWKHVAAFQKFFWLSGKMRGTNQLHFSVSTPFVELTLKEFFSRFLHNHTEQHKTSDVMFATGIETKLYRI